MKHALLSLAVACRFACGAVGSDYYLVFGGGPVVESSQVSIEHNVHFFVRTLQSLGRPLDHLDVLFASGKGSLPDVTFSNAPAVSKLNDLLAKLAERQERQTTPATDYRHNNVSEASGACSRESVFGRLRNLAGRVAPGDRVLIYMTGHGGKGEPAANGHFYTWQNERVNVRDFTAALDRFPVDVDVGVVMVQCYSGAFANIIFTGGDPDKGLAPHHRAGFFATTDARPAAGCTTDAKVEDYKEYSTYFWAAVGGKDRKEQTVRAVDLDGDGRIDLAEAHAYVLAHSATVDVSTKTSDRFLRKYSTLENRIGGTVSAERDFSRLLSMASKEEKLALEQLSEELQLSGQDRVAAADRRSKSIDGQRRQMQRQTGEASRSASRMRDRILRDLMVKWPFIRDAWHPRTRALIESNDAEVLKAIEAHAEFSGWMQQRKRAADLKERDLDLEREWAKLQRVRQVAESVALAHNLPLVADGEKTQRYRDLVKLEHWSLDRQTRQAAGN